MAHKYRNTNESVYVKVCLHHGVLLFLVSRGFLLIFVLFTAFDHYDEENNCNRTREKKKRCQKGTKWSQHCRSIRLHSTMYAASCELVLQITDFQEVCQTYCRIPECQPGSRSWVLFQNRSHFFLVPCSSSPAQCSYTLALVWRAEMNTRVDETFIGDVM